MRLIFVSAVAVVALASMLTSWSTATGADQPVQSVTVDEASPSIEGSYSKNPFLRIEVEQHGAIVTSADTDRSERLLVTGSYDKTVRVWSLPDASHDGLLLLNVLRPPIAEGAPGKIFAVAISPDGKFVAAGGYTGFADKERSLFIFDPATGNVLKRLIVPTSIVSLSFSPDGQFLVAGLHRGKGIRVWRVKTWQRHASDTKYGDGVFGLAFDRNGRLATTSFDGRVRLYDAQFARPPVAANAPGGKKPFGVAFSPDAGQIALGYNDASSVSVLDSVTLRLTGALQSGGAATRNLASVAWSRDGRFVFAAGQLQTGELFVVRRWDRTNNDAVRDLTSLGNTNFVFDLQSYGASGVLVATADPSIGAYGQDGRLLFKRGSSSRDMRFYDDLSNKSDFRVSRDGTIVEFRGRHKTSLRFDLSARSLVPADRSGQDLAATRFESETFAITHWYGEHVPRISRKDGTEVRLKLADNEMSTSAAVAPSGTRFALGASYSLRLYGADGILRRQIYAQHFPYAVNITPDERYIVVCYGDGTVRWHRIEDLKEVLALYISEHDREWVAWTPSGHFDSSPGGEFLIGWHVNRGVDQSALFFSASRFSDTFRRPDLIQTVLKNGSVPDDAASKALAPKLPPVVRILGISQNAPGTATIDYNVESPSGLPVTAVRFRVDGVEFAPISTGELIADGPPQYPSVQQVDHKFPVDPAGGAKLAFATASRTSVLPLTAGLNSKWVAVAAASAGRFGDEVAQTYKPTLACPKEAADAANEAIFGVVRVGNSEEASQNGRYELAARLPGQVQQSGGLYVPFCPEALNDRILYALIVGVTKFKDSEMNRRSEIRYAHNDAEEIATFLGRQKPHFYKEVHIVKLTDKDATKENIETKLRWLKDQKLRENDVSILFLAGHGFRRQEDTTGATSDETFFVPYDVDISGNRHEFTSVSDSLIQKFTTPPIERSERRSGGRKIVFVDACHAANLGTTGQDMLVSNLGREGGVVIWASSTGNQKSKELPSLKHGVFTQALLEAFYGQSPYRGSDGNLTQNQLTVWLDERVPILSFNTQTPYTHNRTPVAFPVASVVAKTAPVPPPR